MPRLVASTALLACDKGSAPSPLVSTHFAQMAVMSKPAASILDSAPGENVFPFGTCSITGSPCLPITPGPWSSAAPVFLGPAPVLRADATLRCEAGGCVHVTDPGQHAVDISHEAAAFRAALEQTIEGLDPRLVPEFLRSLALAGAAHIPASALDEAIENIQRQEERLRRDGTAPDQNLSRAKTMLKAMRRTVGVLGSLPDVVAIGDAVLRRDAEGAATKGAGVAGGAAATFGCGLLAVAAGAPTAGLGAVAVGGACLAAGAGGSVAAEAVTSELLDRPS